MSIDRYSDKEYGARAGTRGLSWIRHCLVVTLFLVTMLAGMSSSRAACGFCQCEINSGNRTRALVVTTNIQLRQFTVDRFKEFQLWFVTDFFIRNILPSMRSMASQLTDVGMYQVTVFAALLDTKEQLEVQRLFGDMAAQAHKDYMPSQEMCALGTMSISIGQADRNAKVVAVTLAKMALDRQLGSKGTSAAEGRAQDRSNRLEQFRRLFCNPHDMNGGFEAICAGTCRPAQPGIPPDPGDPTAPTTVPSNCGATGGAAYTSNFNRWNRDINYNLTIGMPKTLDISFSGNASGGSPPTATDDEEDVVAIGNYLFAHDVFDRMSENVMATDINEGDYMEARSIIAKRSVAYNSFASIIGLEAPGSAGSSGNFVLNAMRQLKLKRGTAGADIGRPQSELALLEVLAHQIYENPQFYMGLYDQPVNLERREVAMQAIGLMVDRTSFESELRTEALLSVLLEMNLSDHEKALQNRLNRLTTGDRKN